MASEKNFENKVKSYLDSIGAWYVKYWGGGMFTKSGIPDLLVCFQGNFIALEIKAEKGKVSPLQEFQIDKIRKAGGYAYAVYPSNFSDLQKFFNYLGGERNCDFHIVESNVLDSAGKSLNTATSKSLK